MAPRQATGDLGLTGRQEVRAAAHQRTLEGLLLFRFESILSATARLRIPETNGPAEAVGVDEKYVRHATLRSKPVKFLSSQDNARAMLKEHCRVPARSSFPDKAEET